MRLLPFAVLLAEVLVFYRHVLFSRFTIPYDLPTYHLSLAAFLAKSLHSGHLPLWDPYTYCGFPVYADLTAQVFYPPTILVALMGGPSLLYALELQLIAHVLAAGIFTYLLLRRLRLGIAAALIGATIYQLGAFFASQAQHLGAVDAAAWMPLAWLAVLSLAERFAWRWLMTLTISFALSLLAGFPQVTAVVVASSFLLAVILMLFPRCSLRLPLGVVAAGVWAALIGAVQLLPTRELTHLSIAVLRSDWMKVSASGIPPQAMLSLVLPNYFGVFQYGSGPWTQPWNPTFLYLYCSIGGLALALAAVATRRHKLTTAFAIMTAISAMWMMGDQTPVGRLIFALLPNLVRASLYAEFAMGAFVLGIAVLAAFGAQHLFAAPRMSRFSHGAATVMERFVSVVAVAVVALDLILAGSGRPMNITRDPGVSHDQMDGFREIPEGVRALVNTATPPWRIDTVEGHPYWAQCAPLLEVPSANGNDPFALQRFMQVRLSFCKGERWGRYYEASNLDSPVLDLLSVRYLLSRKPLAHPKLMHVADVPGQWIYENRGAAPRFFLVPHVQPAKDVGHALEILRSPEFDSRATAVVEGATALSGSGPLLPVKVLHYEPQRVVLETDAASAAFLVTSEAYYPGWRAWIDDREQPLVLTNVAFRGLPVPPGRHTVRMQFSPRVLREGAWITLMSLVPLLAGAVRLAFGDNIQHNASWSSRTSSKPPSIS